MTHFTFSIIIPTYKRELLLKEAIASALCQETDAEFEIIVVDDDPGHEVTRLTQNIIDCFNNDRIRYYQNEDNLGCYDTMNRCVQLARHEHIVILHDDDLLHPNYLASICNVLCSNKNIDMLFCDKKVIINKQPINKTGLYKINRHVKKVLNINNYPVEIKQSDFFIHNIVGGPSGVLLKKSKIAEIGYFKESLFPIADYYFWIEYCSRFKVYMLPNELASCRQENNITLSDGMYPWLLETCYKLQTNFLRENIVHGFLAKPYPYESIKIRIDSLSKNTGILLNLDYCYSKATGRGYRLNIFNRFRAKLYLLSTGVIWVLRLLKVRFIHC